MTIAIGSSTAAGELFGVVHPKTKPGCLCGIPYRDYQYGQRSRSEIVVSRTALLLPSRRALRDAVNPTVFESRTESSNRDIERINRDGLNRLRVDRRSTNSTIDATPRGTRERIAESRDIELLPTPMTAQPLIVDREVTVRDSQTAFSAATPRPAARQIKLYQLDRSALAIDHCQVSGMAMQLDHDGNWILSLRADQNRQPIGDEPQSFNPRLHLKRNQFHLALRCLGSFQTSVRDAVVGAGRPVLADLLPRPFWVENGQPRHMRLSGNSWTVADNFHEIDRVEIEFYYV
ncbi:MAG: hypothetical protein H8E66_02035 [Planctomycetes bacterium]|nr:hypothetical protein [Planctomycetota bacterium]